MGVETLLKMLPDTYKWCAFDFELISNSLQTFWICVTFENSSLVFTALHIHAFRSFLHTAKVSWSLLAHPRLCDEGNIRGLNVRFLKAVGISISLVNVLFWRLRCHWRTLSVLTGTDNHAFSACQDMSSCSKGITDLNDQSQGPGVTLGGS